MCGSAVPGPRGSSRKPLQGSVEHRGRGLVDPERLDGGEDLLLVARQGHAHSKQVSTATERADSDEDGKHVW